MGFGAKLHAPFLVLGIANVQLRVGALGIFLNKFEWRLGLMLFASGPPVQIAGTNVAGISPKDSLRTGSGRSRLLRDRARCRQQDEENSHPVFYRRSHCAL